jgi:hypothetical protein
MTPEEKKAKNAERARRHYAKHAEACRAKARAYRAANPQLVRNRKNDAQRRVRQSPEVVAKHRAASRVFYWENRDACRDRYFQKRYGISLAEFQGMLEHQAGLCGICTRPMTPGRDTHVDHDHETGRVRRILCQACNLLMGHVDRDPLAVSAGFAYAEMWV